MTKKTNADYQRTRRERLRKQGLRPGEVWVAPEHWPTIRKLEKELQKRFLERKEENN